MTIMRHLVYIFEDKSHILRIGLSSDIRKCTSSNSEDERLVYLRLFLEPFDAVAHKHMLDDLSVETVRHIIYKHREITDVLMKTLSTAY